MTPGQTFKRGGQLYRCLGTREHQMGNGRWIDLFRLESACADCGRAFVCLAAGRAIKAGNLNRRCEEHRRPGAPANPTGRRPTRKAPPRGPTAPKPSLPTIEELLA